jgi:glutamate--cysteine ligase catalytic subunit
MGLLSKGTPLTWADTKEYVQLVKQTGVLQFLSNYHRLKDRPPDELKWGDEIEYALISLDDEKKRAQVHLIGPDILQNLQGTQLNDPENHPSKWGPE